MSGEKLAISLLGGFSVAVDDDVIPGGEWHLKRAADLVKMLALAARRRLPREQVIEALWPGGDPARSAVNLRKVAFETRQILGRSDGIVLEDGLVELAPDHRVLTDVDEFTAAAARALASGDPADCRAAASQYRGDLLPDDPYATWCENERRHLRGLFHEVLEQGQLWGRLLHEQPANERAHREIMRGQLERGDRTGAMRQFELLRATLREELGVSPGEETVALYEQALNMDGRDVPTAAERARALLAWGLVHWRRSDLAEAERTAEEARALCIDAGLPRELTEASELLALIAYAQGRWRDVFARGLAESVKADAELAPFVFDANMCMSEFALWEQTGISDVAELGRQLIRISADSGSVQAEAIGRLLRGEAALLSGRDAATARADLNRSAQLHEDTSSITGWALSVERLAQLDSRSGDRSRASDGHRHALRIAEKTAVTDHLIPLIYGGLIRDEPDDQSLAAVAAAEAAFDQLTPCDTCAMSFRVTASAVYARSGQVDRAQEYLAEARRVAQMWSGGPWQAAVDEADAAAQLAQGAAPSDVAVLYRRAGERFRLAHHHGDSDRCERAAAALSPQPASRAAR
ncbi:AfsR/SARP family transcriptional regulator [Leifsonia sp. 2MCAF36]|uniref:AfsR/SARP family transcriptional regulator n=1 Tax=Leifsonia sp. 2MCAF36 TaxID=3232988 RepID=UPI003F9C5880